MTPRAKRATAAGREPTLSNLAKVFYPATGFTKGDVIDYYRGIAPALLPHLEGRPVALKRYPDGVEGGFFFEKRCPSYRPTWLRTASVRTASGQRLRFCVCEDEASLLWLENLAALELHPYLFRVEKPSVPTMVVFDLDPGPPADLLDCIEVGLRLRGALDHLGLASFAKTSGGKGLHVYVPLNTAATFARTKAFARTVARSFERDDPDRIVSRMRTAERRGKVFIDWSQNDAAKTTVSVYSLRARARPVVSMPVTWAELERARRARRYDRLLLDATAVVDRVRKLGDLFREVLTLRQSLPE